MDKQEIAQKIKNLRIERKMTQNALAHQAGVSPTYIYQLERGEKSPTLEYLDHICWGLGISIEEFFSAKSARAQEAVGGDRLASLTAEQKRLLNNFLNSL